MYEIALNMNEERSPMLSNIGRCYFNDKDYFKAIEFANRAIEENPNNFKGESMLQTVGYSIKGESYGNLAKIERKLSYATEAKKYRIISSLELCRNVS